MSWKSTFCATIAAIALVAQVRADEGNSPAPKIIELKEVSLVGMTAKGEVQWIEKGIDLGDFQRGYPVYGQREPDESTRYPAFATEDVWYGTLQIGAWRDSDKLSAAIAITKSARDVERCDLLYVDTDFDGDLTDETPSRTTEDERETILLPNYWRSTGDDQIIIHFKPVTLDLPEQYPLRPYTVYPFIVKGTAKIDDEEQEYLSLFYRRPTAMTGKASLFGKKYTVMLGELSVGTYESPTTTILLGTEDGQRGGSHYEKRLGWLRYEDGRFWEFSASPDGSRLKVAPCTGAMGVLRLSAGDRSFEEVTMRGYISSKTRAVPLGDVDNRGEYGGFEASRECRLPVGDYMPSWVTLNYGNLRLFVSESYHSDGKPRDSTRQRHYAIQIREDKPFVFDFSDEPDVLFALPGKDAEFKPGDKVEVKPVLYVPALDMMIRNVYDTQEKVEKTETFGDQTSTYKTDKSLDPTVVIRNSQGEVMAEGTAPFG